MQEPAAGVSAAEEGRGCPLLRAPGRLVVSPSNSAPNWCMNNSTHNPSRRTWAGVFGTSGSAKGGSTATVALPPNPPAQPTTSCAPLHTRAVNSNEPAWVGNKDTLKHRARRSTHTHGRACHSGVGPLRSTPSNAHQHDTGWPRLAHKGRRPHLVCVSARLVHSWTLQFATSPNLPWHPTPRGKQQ